MPQEKKARVEGADSDVAAFIDEVNTGYEKVHLAFENQFWGTKMALAEPAGEFSTKKLGATKEAMEAFLRRPDLLRRAEEVIASGKGSESQRATLDVFKRTFGCYQMSDDEAVAIRKSTTDVEDKLNAARNKMRLGFTNPATGEFVEKSSVGLRTTMKTASDESTRRAAWEGLRSIGDFILANGFIDVVKGRNAMAKRLGHEDFYDYKVTQAEGFGKARLFEILDTLLRGSDRLLLRARARLHADKGASALEPWNTGFLMAGDVEKQLDPYFPFERSIETWGRCFHRLGIGYRSATMTLDLLDRNGKYSNGFCHWPQPAWVKPDGSWQPSRANFTSLADPAAVGSGKTALTTLMHEAGHAAHFANIEMPSPLFSQERAPTSVAYAENQSMFLDSLVSDAAWRGRYAKSREGETLPWELHKAEIDATHPYAVFMLRSMLSVPYFEKALYELPDDELTPERVLRLADQIEVDVQGGLAARPLLSVPHIISDEASCYYHGYVLAEMSVHQTRAHFLKQGPIVDNPAVGKALCEVYWQPGNSATFLDLVKALTGAPLTGDAWVAALEEDLAEKIASEKREYDAAVVAAAQGGGEAGDDVDLDVRVMIKDGDELIADTEALGGFVPACRTFASYVRKRLA